ncbi:FISUMP domain-containing protein [Balneolaceae bacterium ANBcel3]|nr:FISUMP domain-containing protein [Balneolaceae bacterium ANBcel3]
MNHSFRISIVFVLGLFFLFPSTSNYIEYTISGRLTDSSVTPVSGKNIKLKDHQGHIFASGITGSDGQFHLSYIDTLEKAHTPTAIDREFLSEFRLGASYPNPFNPRTHIPFEVPESGSVLVSVYNILGQQLLSRSFYAGTGSHTIEVNLGGNLAQGTYLLRVEGEGYALSQTMTFVSAGMGGGYSEIAMHSSGATRFSSASKHDHGRYVSNDSFLLVVEACEIFEQMEMEVSAYSHIELGDLQLTRKAYALTIMVEGEGSVTQEVISAKSYEHGTQVRLTAVPAEGWRFVNWNDDSSHSEKEITVLIQKDTIMTAWFRQKAGLPDVMTLQATDIQNRTAVSGGIITHDGFASILSRGVVWGKSSSPSLQDHDGMTSDGEESGEFSSLISGLKPGTSYFYRAYAVNSAGTAYGNEYELKTESLFRYGEEVSDIDGNIYSTVIIGDQEWMTSNLRVSRYRNGGILTDKSDVDNWPGTDGAFAVYSHTGITGLNSREDVIEAYGKLYNRYAVMDSRGVCPEGWKVPEDKDWEVLEQFIVTNGYSEDFEGAETQVGKALKSCRQMFSPLGEECAVSEHPRWAVSHEYGEDLFGFSAHPGGMRMNNEYMEAGFSGMWWTLSNTNLHSLRISYDVGLLYRFGSDANGYSVRCLKEP